MNGSSRRGRNKPSHNGQPRGRAGAATNTKTKQSALSHGAIPRAELLARFANRTRACRDAATITQEELAAATGMRQPYISDIERGVVNPTLTTIANIAVALGVPARDLI